MTMAKFEITLVRTRQHTVTLEVEANSEEEAEAAALLHEANSERRLFWALYPTVDEVEVDGIQHVSMR